MKPRVFVGCVGLAVVALIATHRQDKEEQLTPKPIVLPRPVQILMPGNLCDNMQGTLQFWVRAVLEAPYDKRSVPFAEVVRVREDMRRVGCG